MPSTLTNPLTESFEDRFIGLSAHQLLQWSVDEFGASLAVSTSFGIQSSVMLHLATMISPDIKVIWVDTGYLPPETLAYTETLTERLGLNLHTYRSAITPDEMESRHGRLWESENVEDLHLYDHIRKVEPMHRALEDLNVRGWISGLRSSQTDYRKRLRPLKRTGDLYRIYPILEWSNRDTFYYMQDNDLPQHPLFAQGYATVGDAHSSRPLDADDATERDTRFRGRKQECGLHIS
ncbi:MAG: phosphoadenylyl-sulfate reductase [Planctomycetota bacterium]